MGLDVLIVDYFKGSGDGDAFDSYQELGRFVDMVKNKICGDMGICGIGAAQATTTGKVADSATISQRISSLTLRLSTQFYTVHEKRTQRSSLKQYIRSLKKN